MDGGLLGRHRHLRRRAAAEAEDDALDRGRPLQPDATDDEIGAAGADGAAGRRPRGRSPDAKARELITYLNAVCRPDGRHWTNERVVVFTEYRDTQIWLADLLRQEGLGGDRLGAAARRHGRRRARAARGWRSRPTRPSTRCASCSPPTPPARASTCRTTATGWSTTTSRSTRTGWSSASAASTGTARRRPPEVRHFVGTGLGRPVDAYEADLEFLSRVATKVAQMEDDLGRGQRGARRRRAAADARRARSTSTSSRPAGDKRTGRTCRPSPTCASRCAGCAPTWTRPSHELGITPAAVKRVVDTALELARQQPLAPAPRRQVPDRRASTTCRR